MDAIIRAVIVYLMLVLLFRLAGKRTLAETTTFDLVLALIISESIQQAMISQDSSVTHALLLVIGLIGFDIIMSIAKQKSATIARLVEGLPVVVIRNGKLQQQAMEKERVDEEDLLEAARLKHGLARLDDVAYAVVERNGDISIIPRERLAR